MITLPNSLTLWGRWQAVVAPFAPPATVVAAIYADLGQRYTADGRFYHTLEHLRLMFAVLDGMGGTAVSDPALLFAVWFHDAVYQPAATDNEAQSAALAAQALTRLAVPAPIIQRVGQLILLTQTHPHDVTDLDACLLLDADLSILAADAAGYGRYARQIRREYAHVPDDLYRRGRTTVLQRFLARPRLFLTPALALAEAAARANLQQELATLTYAAGGADPLAEWL